MRQVTRSTWRRRGGVLTFVLAALASTLILAASGSALNTSASVLTAAPDPDSVSFKLDGCKNDGTITLPNGSGDFICPDAVYTTGNLGKGWNELDLVPFRLTANAGNSAPATQTYSLAIAVDRLDAGRPGYDVLSVPVLNTSLSDASCSAPTVGAAQTTGTTTQSLYRIVTITQAKNTTCVYDYYARLALGSHLYPGSSLHANLLNQDLSNSGIGSKEVSIPVNEIAPQELTKDMSATQDSDHAWDITKSPTPADLSFGNTCNPSAARSAAVSITVTWHKLAADPFGPITVITHVYATNPAARVVTLNLSDDIRSGTTVLDTAVAGPTDIPANTKMLVLTHQTTVPSGTTSLNDIATGTYTDKVTGIPIPGSTTATASATVQASGIELNQSAVVNDLESITGAGFSYSTDSVSGASGAFDLGYVAGTPTTGSVSWTSDSQSGSGSATFAKTVYVDSGTSSSGTLDDTATLTGSDGFTTSANASVDLSASAQVALTISKTIPNVLQGTDTQSFTFHVFNSSNVEVATPSISFSAGQTSKSTTVNGLAPGAYTVKETTATGWAPQNDQQIDLGLPTCSGTVSFTNTLNPANAKAVKVTQPAGSEGGWEMILNGPGTPSGGEKVLTNASGNAVFTTQLQEGSYTITETAQTGWDQISATGECSFTVNYPANAGHEYVCTITNRQRGHIIVKKLTDPAGSSQSFEFDPSYSTTNFFLTDTQTSDSGALIPGSYSVAEVNIPTGWDLTGSSCTDGSPVTAISLQAGETVTCTFNNRQRGHIIVKKLTSPAGSSQSFEFDPSYSTTNFFLTDTQTSDSGALIPGSYSVAEVNIPTGWDLTGSSCTDGSPVTAISLQAGETVTCTFNNRQRGKAKVIKTVSGAALTGSQNFTFQLRSGASVISSGTTLETLVATAGNGGVLNFTTLLVPGTTYQLCEIVMPGWSSSLGTFVPDSFMPPDGIAPNPNVDNSILCINFTVAAGETKTYNVDNTPPPGGRALTIGFWKNWASCTKSALKKANSLDQALAAASVIPDGQSKPGVVVSASSGIFDLFGPTYYLVLHGSTATPNVAPDCGAAVNLLNKSTIAANAKKMSSDPLFNMTAQLVGAELNYAAGAGKNGTTTINITSAVLLNGAFAFNGLTHGNLTAAATGKANCLATQLDNYNNDRPVTVCP